ncbi:MAG: DUF4893 domain-containing protein [Sphingomonas sp.]|nr:DUF4893 domain-containing protein [Sphingomonas sp.]
MAPRAGLVFLILASLIASACQTPVPAPPDAVAAPPEADNWRREIRPADAELLDRLSDAWRDGLGEARERGFGRQIDAEGALLVAGGGLPRAALPPGSYRCRLIRLGAGVRRAAFTAYPAYFCHVGAEDALLAFTKQTGSERPAGYIWADGDMRGVFLGALVQGTETEVRAYGQDTARDLVGVVERVGPFRYRLIMPWPRNGAKADVLELVPVVADTP